MSHQKRSDLERLIFTGRARAVVAADSRQLAVHNAIVGASPEAQRIAVSRWHRIQPYVNSWNRSRDIRKAKRRSVTRWLARYRSAQVNFGNGFIGLLPTARTGNPGSHLSPEVQKLMDEFIVQRFENHRCASLAHVWGLLCKACDSQALTPPSFKTFSKHVRARPQYLQISKRKGPRPAYQKKKFVNFLDLATPPHGDRPWEIAHIDHTVLDIELVCSRTKKNLGRPYLSLMTDAYTRRILAISISYSPESSESNTRVLRECVQRHHRLPSRIVVDNGKGFNSIYFDTLLAAYSVTKVCRPPANARVGSVCERLFGTNNTMFVHNLLGNTKLMKDVRSVSDSVNPKNLAVWTLEAFEVPRFDGHELGPNKGLNHDKAERCRGNTTAV